MEDRKRVLKRKVIGILFAGLLIGTIFTGCIEKEEVKKEEIRPGEVLIKIDPRIELMYAVMCSTTSWAEDEFTELDFEYKDEFCNHFSEYKDHEAVKMADLLIKDEGQKKLFRLKVSLFMLCHTKPPEFKLREGESLGLMINSNGFEQEANWAKFSGLLRQYIKDTDFMKFYYQHDEFYKTVSINSNHLKIENSLSILENYYGIKRKFTTILAPLANHSLTVGRTPAVTIFSPTKVENNLPVFEDENYRCMRSLSHGFVHPIIYEHMDEVNKYQKLFRPIQGKIREVYPEWHRFLNAQIIEAVLARYILHTEGAENAIKYVHTQYSRGFIYTEPLYYKLAEYAENRDKYHSFEDFFPEILTFLSNLDPTTHKKLAVPKKE